MDTEESLNSVGDLIRARPRRFNDGTSSIAASWDLPYVMYERVDENVGCSRFIAGGGNCLLHVHEVALVLEVSFARSFPYYSGQHPDVYLRIFTSSGSMGWARSSWCEKITEIPLSGSINV